jgi:hypothetical protein
VLLKIDERPTEKSLSRRYLRMDCASPHKTVVEAIMAGYPAVEIITLLHNLPTTDRQAILCSACCAHNEIAHISIDHGNEISRLLASECPFFVDGRPTCGEAWRLTASLLEE